MTLLANRTLLLTGGRQVGKSTALHAAVARLRCEHVEVSGLLTERTGAHDLQVTELHTGSHYPLTDPFRDVAGSPTRQFTMNEDALRRSAQALEASFPTQVFVLDELGPLELVHHQGWVVAFELLSHGAYELAIIVVRPELLGTAIIALPGTSFTVLHVTSDNRDALPERLAGAILQHLAMQAAVQPGTSL
jgi:nucleoside-triphosphatase THEP1